MALYFNELKFSHFTFGLYYLAVISLISVSVTIFDKIKAKAHGRRVPENTLILLSMLGGSAAMYITMRVIRHKTLHKKFMVGIPFIMLAQCILIVILLKYF